MQYYHLCGALQNAKRENARRTLSGLSISTAELRLALTITLTLTDTGFAVWTLLLGYRRRSDPNVLVLVLVDEVILRFSVPNSYRQK